MEQSGGTPSAKICLDSGYGSDPTIRGKMLSNDGRRSSTPIALATPTRKEEKRERWETRNALSKPQKDLLGEFRKVRFVIEVSEWECGFECALRQSHGHQHHECQTLWVVFGID